MTDRMGRGELEWWSRGHQTLISLLSEFFKHNLEGGAPPVINDPNTMKNGQNCIESVNLHGGLQKSSNQIFCVNLFF